MIAPARYPRPHDFNDLGDFVIETSLAFNRTANTEGTHDVRPERITDLDIEANQPITMLTSRGQEVEGPRISRDEMDRIVDAFLPGDLAKKYGETSDAFGRLKLDNDEADIGIVRLHLWRTDTGPVLTMRVQPIAPPEWKRLRAPNVIVELLRQKRQGMIWFTGPVRSGKSWTMHGAIEELNVHGPSRRVVIIGDPPEFSHKRKHAKIRNREIGFDTASYQAAINGALRVNPHILVASELRGDVETSRSFLQMGQLSCLGLCGMHVQTTYGALNRFVNPFPEGEREDVVTTIEETLLAIVNQRVVPTVTGGEILATELLQINDQTRSLLRTPRQLRGAMQGKRDEGMWLLEEDLSELCSDGIITPETARQYANDQEFLSV